MNIILKLVAVIFFTFCAYAMVIYMPVSLRNEASCFSQGYSKSYVTVGLESYCIAVRRGKEIVVKQ